jgi:hypothetical protein
MQVLLDAAVPCEPETADNVVPLTHVMAEAASWPRLRTQCGAGRWPTPTVPPATARWLDDGAFARWTLGSYPPLDVLLSAVCDLLAPALSERVDDVVHELHPDIDSRGWG